MKTLRYKIIASYISLLIIFVSCMFPVITKSVQKIVVRSMTDCADDLISTIKEAEDDVSIVQIMKYQQPHLFFRVGIINDKQQLIYDSHTKRLFGSTFFPFQFTTHSEIEGALKDGVGYAEKYSYVLEQKLVYLAKKFPFHDKDYIIRIAFPQEYIQELKRNFEYGFLLFSSVILILFSVMTGLILYHLTTPIRHIIKAIQPYQEGKIAAIPEITLKPYLKDEFSQLAETLNSLSYKIQTQIEKLTHEHSEKEALLQSLAEGVLAVDTNMEVIYANATAKKFLKLDDKTIGSRFPEELHPRCARFLIQAKETRKAVNETIDIHLDNKKMYLNIVASPLVNGGGILILHDMTMHYKIIDMRKDFIANASHELKTPITIIRGFAETLHDNLHLDKQIIEDITDKIVKNCRRMTKTITNLLTLADIDHLPAFKLAQCDMKELIESCKANLLSVYPNAEVTLHFEQDSDSSIEIAPELMEVAIYNLLDNAAKYSKELMHIDVYLKRQAGMMHIIVEDHGIGIPQHDLEHIYQRFYTVNKMHSKKLGGSGLGLSIVKTIVKEHFGIISAESTVGEGTRFIIMLPDNIREKLPVQQPLHPYGAE